MGVDFCEYRLGLVLNNPGVTYANPYQWQQMSAHGKSLMHCKVRQWLDKWWCGGIQHAYCPFKHTRILWHHHSPDTLVSPIILGNLDLFDGNLPPEIYKFFYLHDLHPHLAMLSDLRLWKGLLIIFGPHPGVTSSIQTSPLYVTPTITQPTVPHGIRKRSYCLNLAEK